MNERLRRTIGCVGLLALSWVAACDCMEDQSIRHGRFCVTNGWNVARSLTALSPIAEVDVEHLVLSYTVDGAEYRVAYDVASVNTIEGSCPDRSESYALVRRGIGRVGGGAVPADEDAFWPADAELRAEADRTGAGVNTLYLGRSGYHLSGGTYCPALEDDRDAGAEADAGGGAAECTVP